MRKIEQLVCVGVLAAVINLSLLPASTEAANVYRITSKGKDGKTKTYQLTFGGSKTTDRLVAFCPKNKKFVSITWEYSKGEKPPKPVSWIWDSTTGKTIPLYRFPGSPYPLPEIPKVSAIKVCPFTGDKRFKVELVGHDD